MMQVKIDPCPRMGDSKHIEQGSLLYLFIGIDICLKTREDLLTHCGQELGIIQGRVEDNFGIQNQFPLVGIIIQKVWFYPECIYFRDSLEPAPQCYIILVAHLYFSDLLPSQRLTTLLLAINAILIN